MKYFLHRFLSWSGAIAVAVHPKAVSVYRRAWNPYHPFNWLIIFLCLIVAIVERGLRVIPEFVQEATKNMNYTEFKNIRRMLRSGELIAPPRKKYTKSW